MKVEMTSESPVRRTLRVEVPPERVASTTESVLREYRKQTRIAGFRPGKAPLSVLRKRLGQQLTEDVRERVVGDSFREALREQHVHPLGDPTVEELHHEDGGPLTYRASFEVLPEIEPRNYEGLRVRRPSTSVSEADVEGSLEELRQARTRWVAEEGRRAATGDLLVADAEGEPEGGEPFKHENTSIELGRPDNLPAFNEKLAGLAAGEGVEVSVDYPAEFRVADLAGRTVRYRLTVREVKRREVPELDDELARELGDFEDLAALRVRLRQDLEARKRHEAEHALQQSLLEKFLIENPVVLPESLVDAEIRHRLEELVRRMILQGIDPQKVEIDWVALRKRQEEPARRSVHARLLLDALGRHRGIEVTAEEVERRLRLEAERAGESFEALHAAAKKGHGLQLLRSQLLREKTLDYLTSVANIDREE